MKKLLCILFVLVSGTVVYAQKDSIGASQAQQYIGKTVLLCDRIKDGHMDNISKDEPTIVYVGDTYETRTLALIFTKDVLKAFSFDPEKRMENHNFCITGKITTYKGKPAIYVKSEAELHVEE